MRSVDRNRSRQSRQSYKARRAANAIDNARIGGFSRMERVYNGIMNPKKKEDFRGLTKADRLYLKRYYRIAVEEERTLKTFRKELLSGKTDDEKRVLLDSYLRVPIQDLLLLRKLKADERAKRLAKLMALALEESTGNKCGHNKAHFTEQLAHASPYDLRQTTDYYGNPLSASDKKGKRKPEIIYQVIDRLIFMALIPDKNMTLFYKKVNYEVKVNGDWLRLIRTEGREAMTKIMIFMLLYWDPRSMRVGVPIDYDKTLFSGISIATIAEHAGLTYSRVTRALRLLEEQGFLHKTSKVNKDGKVKSTQQREKDKKTGEWRGFPVIRVFTNKIFDSVALDQRGEKERAKPTHKVPQHYTEDGRTVDADMKDMTSAGDVISGVFGFEG